MIYIFSSYKNLHLETKKAERVHPEMPGVGLARGHYENDSKVCLFFQIQISECV